MSNKTAVLDALRQMDERPEEAARSLHRFHRAESVLSGNQPRLIDAHPDQWVAVSDGSVVAHGNDLELVLQEIDGMGLARSDIIVRFIERTQRTLIL